MGDYRLSRKLKKNNMLLHLTIGLGLSFLIPPMPYNESCLYLGFGLISTFGGASLIANPIVLYDETDDFKKDCLFLFGMPSSMICSYILLAIIQLNTKIFKYYNIWLTYIGAFISCYIVVKLILWILVNVLVALVSFDPDNIIDYCKRKKKNNVYNLEE